MPKKAQDMAEAGVVSIDDSRRFDTTLDVQEGTVFDRRLESPHMATNSATSAAVLENS